MYNNYLCVHKHTCMYTVYKVSQYSYVCNRIYCSWLYFNVMDMDISNARNIKFTWHGSRLSNLQTFMENAPSIARFFGGFFLGTLRPPTFKLAFLAGGPPMPSTWEWKQRKKSSQDSGPGWLKWHLKDFTVRTMAEWMEVGIPGDVVFLSNQKRDSHTVSNEITVPALQ